MGGISFNLYQKGKNFPKTLLLSCGTCATAWELDLTYEF
jgi:hypothetical protein